ncbi:MAG TPA: GHMP kinase [Spirochaetia bacterium]|nr:GHMP kinase [Spirochaetia bacterium]
MIVCRTPFRISFAGGGSDLRSYYRHQPGMVLSTSINQYMYISIHPYFFSDQTLLKYSKSELVRSNSEIKHPILREVLSMFDVGGVDISSVADIPAGTGLGSSSSFTVGLVHALCAYTGKFASKEFLAETASQIEIERLGEPIGKQDQYAAAYGGLNFVTFRPDESVSVEPVALDGDHIERLQRNLLMFYTGVVRSAGGILSEQKSNLETSSEKRKGLEKMVNLATQLRRELEQHNLDAMGEILHESWQYKRELASGISNPSIDHYYDVARDAGAAGGKLLGAGGGGFFLFYVDLERQDRVRAALSELREFKFRFDHSGSTVVYSH